jgi:hypothetical protein
MRQTNLENLEPQNLGFHHSKWPFFRRWGSRATQNLGFHSKLWFIYVLTIFNDQIYDGQWVDFVGNIFTSKKHTVFTTISIMVFTCFFYHQLLVGSCQLSLVSKPGTIKELDKHG